MSVLNTISAASIRGFQGFDVPGGGITLYQILTNPVSGTYYFGYSLAITATGDRIIVGSRVDTSSPTPTTLGYAFIYVLSGTNTWTLEASLSDAIANSEYGSSVDISGDGNYAIVGAPGYGRAYIYQRSGSTWTLIYNTLGTGSRTGESVAINGDGSWAIIGRPYFASGAGAQAGQVLILNRSGSVFSTHTTFTNTTTAQQRFGNCVDIDDSGDVIVIGRNSQLGTSKPTWSYKTAGVWAFDPTITSVLGGVAAAAGQPNNIKISKDGTYCIWWNPTMTGGTALNQLNQSPPNPVFRTYIGPGSGGSLQSIGQINYDATKILLARNYYQGYDLTWNLSTTYIIPSLFTSASAVAITDTGTYKILSNYTAVYIYS